MLLMIKAHGWILRSTGLCNMDVAAKHPRGISPPGMDLRRTDERSIHLWANLPISYKSISSLDRAIIKVLNPSQACFSVLDNNHNLKGVITRAGVSFYEYLSSHLVSPVWLVVHHSLSEGYIDCFLQQRYQYNC